MAKDFVTFITKNPLYLLCSVVYYIFGSLSFGGKAVHFILVFLLYLVSLLVAFSPLGEKLLRLIEKARSIETSKEKELLNPLFEEVYTEAKRRFPSLGYIELCIIDTITVRACAMGKHTIAITKGAMETFSGDELKGIIAHEIAHIVYLDTMARIYAIIANGIYTIMFLVIKLILFFIELFHSVEGESHKMGFAIRVVRLFFELLIFLEMLLMQAVLAIDSRKSEFRADRFAYELGYGEELTTALYLLEKINLGDDSGIIQKMIASHPRITARIANLEWLKDYAQQPVPPPYQPIYPPYDMPFPPYTQPVYSSPSGYVSPFSEDRQPQDNLSDEKPAEEGLPF